MSPQFGTPAANSIVDSQVNSAAAITLSKLADPGAGKVLGSNSGAAAVFPPGYQLAYAAITGNVSVVSTTESTGTSVGSLGAVTYDGSAVKFKFRVTGIQPGVADQVTVSIFDGATQVGRLTRVFNTAPATLQAQTAGSGEMQFSPSAGSHTYTFTAFVTSAAGTIVAGVGGTGVAVNGFIEATKV